MQIIAGRLNRRVELLRPTQGQTDSGAPLTSFVADGFRSCARLRWNPTADELEPQRQATAAVTLLLRRDTLTRQITTEWRLMFEGALMQVDGVDAEPADGSLVLTCTAVQE